MPLLEASSFVGFVSVYTTSDFPVVIRRVGRCGHLVQLFVIKHYTVYISITTKRDTFFHYPSQQRLGGGAAILFQTIAFHLSHL